MHANDCNIKRTYALFVRKGTLSLLSASSLGGINDKYCVYDSTDDDYYKNETNEIMVTMMMM